MPASLPSESHPTITCYTKQAWADSWTERPLMQALTIVDQAAPGHSSATLRYRYGRGMMPALGSRAEDTALATITRGSLTGHYVKIVVDGLGTWWGVIVDVSDTRHGTLSSSIVSGEEQYTAYGLTWFLDQSAPVTQSKVKTSSSTVTIERAIPFNGGTGGDRKEGRRVGWKNYESTAKIFTDRTVTTSPAAWTAANAIEYLFEHFAPKNAAGSELLPFALHASALTFLAYELPTLDYDGQTLWQILNRIIDRRRGLGWHATISGSDVQIVVWSQNQADITLPSGSTIPANANQQSYNFDSAVNIKQASLSTTLLTRYDQVLVLGERSGSVFTVRPTTNMEPDWSTADQTKYNLGASQLAGYSALSDTDKQAANMDRRADDSLSRVYSWWRPKKTWTGRSDTDPSTGTAPYALPKIDEDGEYDLADYAIIQRAALRFEPFTPLRPGVNYTAAITPDTDGSDDQESDFLPPLLLLQADPIRGTGSNDGGWVHCERLNQSTSTGSDKRAYEYSVDLAVRQDAPGLILRTVGVPQHFLCSDLFEALTSGDSSPGSAGFDKNDWLATVYMRQDSRCRAQYPLQADLPSLDLIRQLRIFIPNAYLDFLIQGTIVGTEAGKLLKAANGGLIRDDRQRLKDIARMAFAWYGQDRRILQLSFRSLDTAFAVGTMITTVGTGGATITVNTCITSVTYDLVAGTTAFSTQFGELDFTVT